MLPRHDDPPVLDHASMVSSGTDLAPRSVTEVVMGRLQSKVAIITGATSGIGRACAIRFAEEGAHLVVAGRRRERGQAVAAALGGQATFVPSDVSREADIRALVERTLERFGRIDCVVSNAG